MTVVRNKSVKEWPEDERPRERLIAHGASALSEAQLLAILIRNGKSGRTAVDLGRELLERFGSLAGIEQASITEICVVEGMGPAKAAELKAAIELGRRYQLLLSIPGFGATSALHTLAELALLPAGMDVRQWVAYAGLDPRQHTSGSSVEKKPRISKAGNRHLRRALYMPALVAIRRQPHLRAYYQHLRDRGKLKMVALIAVMRKLLHAIYGMFKHQQPFDGSKVYRLPGPHTSPPLNSAQEVAA